MAKGRMRVGGTPHYRSGIWRRRLFSDAGRDRRGFTKGAGGDGADPTRHRSHDPRQIAHRSCHAIMRPSSRGLSRGGNASRIAYRPEAQRNASETPYRVLSPRLVGISRGQEARIRQSAVRRADKRLISVTERPRTPAARERAPTSLWSIETPHYQSRSARVSPSVRGSTYALHGGGGRRMDARDSTQRGAGKPNADS